MGEAVVEGTFSVCHMSVQRDGGTPTSFVRNPAHHAEAMQNFFARTNHDYRRFNYLGEWHSHPSFAIRPSGDDIAAMRDLLADRSVGATFACLVIVRHRPLRPLEIGATAFTPDGHMSPVDVERVR